MNQCQVFCSTDYVRGLTGEELNRIVSENGEEMKALLGKMYTYSGNVNGSAFYLYGIERILSI